MKGDLYLSFVILFQMIVTTLQLLLPLLGIASVETAASYRVIITLLTYLPGVFIVAQRHLNWMAMAFITYFMALLLNYEMFPASHMFIESSQAITLTPISILTILFVTSIRDFGNFKKMLLYVARGSVAISLLYTTANALSPFKNLDETYSMSFGYSMLLPAMFLFSQQGYIDKAMSILLFFLILIDGSRGPVVVAAIFYAYYTLFLSSGKTKRRIFLTIAISAVVAVMILPRMESFQNSRTMFLLQEGELISHDSGREENVYSVVLPKIMESPIVGWGLGGDRYFLDGSYSHNIFIEVFIHYGIFVGTALFLWLLFYCIRMFFSSRTKQIPGEREMFVMMFLYGFVPMLVSGSYLTNFSFAIFIGYLISLKRHQQKAQIVIAKYNNLHTLI